MCFIKKNKVIVVKHYIFCNLGCKGQLFMKLNVLLTVLFFSLIGSYAFGYEGTGNVNLFIGQKMMDSDWGPLDSQGEIGVMCDFQGRGWPVGIAIEFLGSSEEKDGTTAKTSELRLGAKKIWDFRNFPLHPFVGGGLALVSAEIEDDIYDGHDYFYDYYHTESDSDSALGFWLSGGIYATLSTHFNLGVVASISRAKGTLFNHDFELGGDRIGLLLGYHW